MDEASSKFLDQFVQDKILTEKLRQVHHFPQGEFLPPPTGFFEILQGQVDPPEVSATPQGFRFPSPILTPWPENQFCEVIVHRSEHPVGCIVLQHGLFEDSRTIFEFFIRELLKRGFHVFLSTLPFHHHRQPLSSQFSGEFFWSADIHRSRSAIAQAVSELQALERIVRHREHLPTLVCGFSMGGFVALLLASLCKDLFGVVAINPAPNLSGILWDSPLCASIKEDVLASGISFEQLQTAFAPFERIPSPHDSLDQERIQMIYGIYDQFTTTQQYESLIHRWSFTQIHRYPAGHLNTLRMQQLAPDIELFFQTMLASNPSGIFGTGSERPSPVSEVVR